MTEIEALNALKLEGGLQIDGKVKRVAQFFEGLSVAIQALEEIQQYRAIGTIEEFKALKEKNTPMKPIVRGLGQRYCPICKCGGADHFYCTRCGQKLG